MNDLGNNITLHICLIFTAHSPSPGSPTARLLLEYEQHLRNTLAKGMDAESYSLHTFEAIISQSNENLCKTLKPLGVPRHKYSSLH